jgi:hypothetical protein
MKRHVLLLLAALFVLGGAAVFAADLTIDMQVNTVAKDYAGNVLSFKGGINSVDKDQFAPVADATAGASKLLSTEVFNAYRFDVKGQPTLPGALRNLMLYAVANDSTRTGDNLTVAKAADGGILIRFVHRGTAFEILTDASGKLTLPTTGVKMRKIGHTDNTISTDFSASGKTANIDWKKVWDTAIADGKVIGSTTSKTGKVTQDLATSTFFVWSGAYQFTFDGKVLKMSAALDAKKL